MVSFILQRQALEELPLRVVFNDAVLNSLYVNGPPHKGTDAVIPEHSLKKYFLALTKKAGFVKYVS